MSGLKVQILKGFNTYSDDLINKKNTNLNARRQFNTNISDLDDLTGTRVRSNVFAVYQPRRKENTDFGGFNKKNKGSKEIVEKQEIEEKKIIEPEIVQQDEVDITSFLFENEPNKDTNEVTNEVINEVEVEDKKEQFTISEPLLAISDGEVKGVEINDNSVIDMRNIDGYSDTDDSTIMDGHGLVENKKTKKDDLGEKFDKFMEMMKQRFDKDEMRERHEQNMEKMKEGFNTLISKMGMKKSGEGRDRKLSRSSSGSSNDRSKNWGSGISRENLNKMGGKLFSSGVNEYVKNDVKKRCCLKLMKPKMGF
uniref:Uncharacterized protein n=1 Tax=Theileria annulata TaxID=5874 RepID=A0A3B0N0W6_THEAN